MGLFETFKSFNRCDQAVQLDSSWFNVQWFNGRQTELDWNFTFEDSRSVEGQDRLEVQLATSSLMWIPSRVLKKTHMLRCSLIASLQRTVSTPPRVDFRAPRIWIFLSSLQEFFQRTASIQADSIWLRLLLGTSAARCRLAVNYCRCSKPCPVSP